MRYGERRVLRGVHLEVERGEVVALLGPNGAGKTTTMEILEGYRRRSSGDVTVLGRDPQRAGVAWRARVGIVLQSSSDHALWPVGALLRYVAGHFERPWSCGDLLDRVGLADHAGERVARLSGGQRRRLDLALGLVGQPELLFLDEPTTGFDPQARRDVWQLLEDVRDAGATILLTTHGLDEAERLADRVAVLADGRIVALGTPEQLKRGAGSGASLEDAYLQLVAPNERA